MMIFLQLQSQAQSYKIESEIIDKHDRAQDKQSN